MTTMFHGYVLSKRNFAGRGALTGKNHSSAKRARRLNGLKLLLLFLPFFAVIIVLNYIPLFGWTYAFVDYSPGIALSKMTFVGLKYFKIIFSGGSNFGNVMLNTLVISLLKLVSTVVPVIFAISISQLKSSKLSRVIQSITSLPYFISWVLVYAIVFSFFSTDDGVVNKILITLHIINRPTNVLGNVQWAWVVQTLIGIWKETGYLAIIYLAAITGIDRELYDAADVDGANRWQKVLNITIPGITSTYLVLFLLTISNMLSNGFDQYWVFQNSLTTSKLEVFDTYVYRIGIINMQYSFSTAMGIFKTLVSVILLAIANFASKAIRGDYIV